MTEKTTAIRLSAGRRPSIAVVIPQYGRIGGAENMAFQLCERLAAMFDIHVFARKWDCGPSPVTFHKVPMIHFPRWLQPISFAGFAQRKIDSMAFDLVHSHERIFRMDLMTFHGIPHRTWIHDMRQKSLSGFDRATCWAEKKGIENPALKMILPVSTLVKKELSKHYAISEDRVSVMHPGVSIERFSGLNARSCRERIRARHGLSASDVVICFVGMNFEIKRLDLTLQGIAGMKRDGFFPPCPRLLIVGKGDSGPYLKMAEDLGISDQVVFAGVTDEVEAYYLASDLFVMPSRMDTFGLVVLEAMAAGLPVVISANVGRSRSGDPRRQRFYSAGKPNGAGYDRIPDPVNESGTTPVNGRSRQTDCRKSRLGQGCRQNGRNIPDPHRRAEKHSEQN